MNEYYGAQNDFRGYLKHHGIKGQKWGVRNGPPYPLDYKAHNARERKANWQSSLSGGKTPVKKKSKKSVSVEPRKDRRVGNPMIDIIGGHFINSLSGDSIVKWGTIGGKLYRHYKVPEKMANLISTTGYLSSVLVRFLSPALITAGAAFAAKHIINKATGNAQTVNTSRNSKEVNKGFPNRGRVYNCAMCTTAMAMREKGENVIAKESYEPIEMKTVINRSFNNVEHSHITSPNSWKSKTERLINRYGDGSYGNISVYWNEGGGHSLFWKNENGKIKIYDSQIGKEYSLDDFSGLIDGDIYIDRLDTATPKQGVYRYVE